MMASPPHFEESLPKEDEKNSNIVATHYNKLEEKGIEERSKSRIFYMRNFNNWTKSVLINEFLVKIRASLKHNEPLRVLDMCCGKGGDLLKWTKGGITHLICTDIAEVSIQQCEERYKSMKERNANNKFSKTFSAEFFACDSTLHRLREEYQDPSIELSLVSCQFAFHYCFESLKQAECMLRNAAECLKTGGYFIGTIPDANEIIKRQKQEDALSFGNSLYKITFLCDPESPPLFGAKYNFELEGVVDCPEFLVYFPMLVKLARKFGLKLIMKERFEDYFEKHANTRSAQPLLGRMQALETFPSPDHADPNDEEYIHVKSSIRNHPVGTLSKSEWEVSSLYLVFAFEKMKKQINKHGQPEFVDDD